MHITTYVAVSFGYWGRGDTEAAALVQHVKAGGSPRAAKIIVYAVTHPADKAKPFVDDYGSVNYYGEMTKVAEYAKGKRKEFSAA